MKTIKLVLCFTLVACYHVNSAPLDSTCDDAPCSAKECEHFTSPRPYSLFYDIHALHNAQPEGYLLRLPVYIKGRNNARILLSAKQKVNQATPVYDIVIGGGLNQISIRRRLNGHVLRERKMPRLLDAEKAHLFMIEVTTGGQIVVYSSQLSGAPLIVAHDPNPISIRYVSFGRHVEYFYNCRKDEEYPVMQRHPFLDHSTIYPHDTENSLELWCMRYDSWDYKYTSFQEFNEIGPHVVPKGYILRLPFYLQGAKEAHVLLSTTDNPNLARDNVYEILIGGTGSYHVQIRRKALREVLNKVRYPNLLSAARPTKFILEVTEDGKIALYSEHNPFLPVITAHDKSPLKVKYLSFASNKDVLVQYFYNCENDKKEDFTFSTRGNLEEDKEEAIETLEKLVEVPKHDVTRCKSTVQAKENNYEKFIALKDIPGAVQEGSIVNLPFLIKGDKDAHIVLSATDKPNWEHDNVYEFVIGGWDDTKVVLRRRRNNDVLQEEHISNSISKAQATKFVISINAAGFIVVYNDVSSYKPVIWANDPDPIHVKYVSFASNASEVIDYYYDCAQFYERAEVLPGLIQGETTIIQNTTTIEVTIDKEIEIRPNMTTETLVKIIPKPNQRPRLPVLQIHPLLQDTRLYEELSIRKLSRYSVAYEAWTDVYDQLVPVGDLVRPKGFMLQLVTYIQGPESANILLAPSGSLDAVNEDPNVYEIQIGIEGNSWSQIVKKSTGEVIARTFQQNLLSEEHPLRVVVEVSNMGTTKVYTSQNPFAPLLSASVPPLTQFNFLGFSSTQKTHFYYYVDDDTLANAPDVPEETWDNLLKVEHPLLAIQDYPLGFSELFFKRYMKVFQTSEKQTDKYVQFIKLNDIEGVRPFGYRLRLPFYIQGTENAHILLSPKENPTEQDATYEIVIGDLQNSRVSIRKKIRGVTLVDTRVKSVLSKYRKKKFVLEISAVGDIKLYSEDDLYKPLVSVFDPKPFTFDYISFKNYKKEKLDFFYGNIPRENKVKLINELLTEWKEKLTINPLLLGWNDLETSVTIPNLLKYSKYYESWTKKYDTWYPLDKQWQPKGYHVRIPIYLQSPSDAYIVLSDKQNPGPNDKVYDIHIGTSGNSISRLFGKLNKDELATAYEQDLLSEFKPLKVVIEVAYDGSVKVFTAHNMYIPLLHATDASPLAVKYISFASPNRLQVFYNVNEKVLIQKQTLTTTTSQITVFQTTRHPLLVRRDYPIGLADLFFPKYFKNYEVLPDHPLKYVKFIKLTELPEVRPDGYIVRIPFYVQGPGNAHILFAQKENPTEHDDAYEIVLGGWGNSHIVLRKRTNGAVLAKAFWPQILSQHKRKKFVFEITADGEIKFFSQDDLIRPLLHAYDPTPVKVELLSFRNYDNEKLIFHFGNKPEDNNQHVVEELIKIKHPEFVVHPWFKEFNTLRRKLTLKNLWKYGQYHESWTNTYDHFFKVDEVHHRPEGYVLRIPFFIQGAQEARILLSPTQNPDKLKDAVYEIRLGLNENSLSQIGRKIGSEHMVEVHEQDILSEHKVIKVVIEVTPKGEISVWTSHNPWVPLLSVVDPKLVGINYVGFASGSRVQYFWNVDEKVVVKLPTITVETEMSDLTENIKHPLFNVVDYPVGVSDLYFKKYFKIYQTLPEQPDVYVNYVKLSDIDNIRPKDYWIRIPFYIQGSANAHILLSAVEKATELDDAYEILIGEEGNSHIVIRKRLNGAVLAHAYWPNILTAWKRKKFVFEVNHDGVINLFSEDDPFKPLITTFDPLPVHMEYISFKNYLPEKMWFYYGNIIHTETEIEKIKTELLETTYETISVHPLLENWKQLLSKLNVYELVKYGKYYESWQPTYNNFLALTEKNRPSGYVLRYPFYAQGDGGVQILLSTVENPDYDTDTVYEIHIGLDGNSWSRVVKNGYELKRVYEQNILQPYHLTKIIVEITTDGSIKVWTSKNRWIPLITVVGTPLQVKYVSFASTSRVQFFYDTDDEALLTVPVKQVSIENTIHLKHPLFKVIDYPIGVADLYFEKYFKVIETKPELSGHYHHWIQLQELPEVRPNGYFLRFPFYLQGSGNAHVLISSKENPDEFDNAYELVIGAWKNSRIILRKRLNGAVLANVYWPNLLTSFKRKKFVLEITKHGDIKLFVEDLPYKPILTAYDPIPEDWKLDFVSFKNLLREKLQFYYGNVVHDNYDKFVKELVKEKYQKVELHPMFLDYYQFKNYLDIKTLTLNSKYWEAWNNTFTNLIPIEDVYRPSGYSVRFPVYIQGFKDARILLSAKPDPYSNLDQTYVIYLGTDGNTRTTIVRNFNGVELANVHAQNILLPNKPIKVIVEVTSDGTINLWTSHNMYLPLISVKDPNPIPVKYISFSSSTRTQFFYQPLEEVILKAPTTTTTITTITTTVTTTTTTVDERSKHPLLAELDYPVGLSELWFRRYLKLYEAKPDVSANYTQYIKLSDLQGIRPKGYLVRIPFYVQGTENAHVLLTSVQDPTFEDDAYEIVIGGFKNSRILIKKRVDGAILADVYWPNVLSEWKKTKFVFEVLVGGEVRLWSDLTPYKPLVETYDPRPLLLEYLSFRNRLKERIYFYYGNKPEQPLKEISTELLTFQYGQLSVNSLLEKWSILWPKLDTKVLYQNSKYYEAWNNVYNNFVKVTDLWRPFGYRLRFPVYINGPSNAKILLSKTPSPGLDDDVYEITLGWRGNSVTRVSKRINGDTWVVAYEQNILSSYKPVKIIVEFSTEGVLKIFTSHNPYVPLLTATDRNPLDIKYVSFSAPTRVQFFWEVNEEKIVTLPTRPSVLLPDLDEGESNIKYPLLSVLDYPLGLEELYFKKYYKVFTTTLTVANKYAQYVTLTDIEGSRPEGYNFRVPFYVRGPENAHVLFTSVQHPTELHNAYELILGGWGNRRILLRKRINGAILADVYWPNVISEWKRKKFIFQISKEGDIYLYSEDNPYKPLLTAFDPEPAQIEFISFKNHLTEKIEFFWGNNPDLPLDKVVQGILDENFGKVTISPLFTNWDKVKPVLDTKYLIKNSKYYESWDNVFGNFLPIDEKYKPGGYNLQFSFYVQGQSDAYILLSNTDKPTVFDENVYEIHIGCDGNSLTRVSKQIGGELLARVYEQNILSVKNPIKIVIEITSDGTVKIWTSRNQYAPLLEWKDPSPTPVKYISFGSKTQVQYFYNVNEEALITTKPVVPVKVKHPILSALEFPLGLAQLFFSKYFKTFETIPFVSNRYTQYVNLEKLEGSRPDGYLVRFPFYVQGSANAHILLSQKIQPSLADNAYEVVIGAFNNKRVIIRKRINGAVLANVYVPNALNALKRKKFILDVLATGELELYSEDDLFTPIATAFDPNPIKLQYVSFKNLQSERLNFFYGYYPGVQKLPSVITMHPLLKDIITIVEKKPSTTVEIGPVDWTKVSPPTAWDHVSPTSSWSWWSGWLAQTGQITTTTTTTTATTQQQKTKWVLDWNYLPFRLPNIVKNSKYVESWDILYDNYVKLEERHRPKGYNLQYTFYVQGSRDAYILLSSSEKPVDTDDVIEIQLGALGNTETRIVRKTDNVLLANILEPNVLSSKYLVKVIVEVTDENELIVYTSNNPYSPLLAYRSPKPIKFNFISFASANRMQYFYDVNEDLLLQTKPVQALVTAPAKPARHPFMYNLNLKPETENIYFTQHFKVYETIETNKYANWIKVANLPEVLPKDYILRFPFYIQGSSNAHVVLSPKENPGLEDNAYELVIGGWGNTRITIRKRIDGYPLADVVLPNVLNVLKKKEFIFEVTLDGELKLYTEENVYTPVLVAYDPKPLKLEYVSFKNHESEKLAFYYGYDPKQQSNIIVQEEKPSTPTTSWLPSWIPTLPTTLPSWVPGKTIVNRFGKWGSTTTTTTTTHVVEQTVVIGTKDPKLVKWEPVTMNPLFQEVLPPTISFETLVKQSQYLESWDNRYTKYVKITGKLSPSGYYLRMPLYIQGSRDALIYLSPTDTPTESDDGYEIQIGSLGNTVVQVVRRKTNTVLKRVIEENILSEWNPTQIVIEVTTGGVIKIFTAHNPFAPILTAEDPDPIPVKYVSMASGTRVQFFYDISESLFIDPLRPLTTTVAPPVVDIKLPTRHPLLSLEVPVGSEEEYFSQYFTVFEVKANNAYEKFFKVADVKGLTPSGYHLRFPFYVEGPANAHLLLSSKDNPSFLDTTYEIVIGGWANTRIEIRKRKSGPLLASVGAPNIISVLKRKKFVVEVTYDGHIRVFSEDDLYKPLAAAYDPKPFRIEYLSFKNYNKEPLKFYYNYNPRNVANRILSKLVPSKYDLKLLKAQCSELVATSTDFKTYVKISDLALTQFDGVGRTFSFYVDGTKDASLLLTNTPTPNEEHDTVYEVLIGCNCKTKPLVIPHKLADVLYYGALTNVKLVKIEVEIANGKIRVYRDNQPDPLTEATFDSNLDLNYVSFGAANEKTGVQFFYNCAL